MLSFIVPPDDPSSAAALPRLVTCIARIQGAGTRGRSDRRGHRLMQGVGLTCGWLIDDQRCRASARWPIADRLSQPGFTQEAWTRTTTPPSGPSGASDHLGLSRLDPHVRDKLIERTRPSCTRTIRCGGWLKTFADKFSWHAPRARRDLLARYRGAIPALDVVEKLPRAAQRAALPRRYFGTPGFLRFGFGGELQHFQEALGENGTVDCVDCSVTEK